MQAQDRLPAQSSPIGPIKSGTGTSSQPHPRGRERKPLKHWWKRRAEEENGEGRGGGENGEFGRGKTAAMFSRAIRFLGRLARDGVLRARSPASSARTMLPAAPGFEAGEGNRRLRAFVSSSLSILSRSSVAHGFK